MPTPIEYVPETHTAPAYAPPSRYASSARAGKAPLTMEMGLSLAVAILALVFWGAYMLMILAGELPLMLAGQ